MIYKHGSVFDTDSRGIGHGVNTKGLMGAGVAVAFKKRYPDMHKAYIGVCEDGTFTPGSSYNWYEESEDRLIFNMASQEFPGANAKMSYLITSAFIAAADAREAGIDYIAIPRIGCGIGGLKWVDVAKALQTIEVITGTEFEVWTPLAIVS